jgi:hypothetical protein
VLIGRLIRLVIVLAVLVGAIALLLSLVVQPFVQHQAADAIGRQLGTKVTVDAGTVLSPGIVSGNVGPLTVKADTYQKGVIPVRNLQAKVHGGSVDLGSLFSGSPKLTWSSLDMTAEVRPGALAKYLRGRLSSAGIPGAERAFVHIQPDGATLIVDKQRIPVRIDAVPPSSVRVTAEGTGAIQSQLSSVLAASVNVGPLPYGLRLTGLKLIANAAVVSAHAAKGHESL